MRGGGPILTLYLIDADNQLTALDTRLRGDWYITVWKWTDGNWRDVSRSRSAIPDRSSGNAVYEYKVLRSSFNMQLSGTYTVSHNPTITTFTLPFKIQLATWLDYWTNPVRTHSYYDLVYIKAYTSPEPTVTLGTEETL